MTSLESEVLEKLQQPGRLLYPDTLAAILQHPRSQIDDAIDSLHDQRLVVRNRCGQWAVSPQLRRAAL